MRKKSGFTIIEVVLVLAIAGLIFLMVFIALPALQRSQRDTQREEDMSRAQTAVVSFQKVNRGRTPCGSWDTGCVAANSWGSCDPGGGASGFCERYLLVGGDTFEDPDGTPYIFVNGGTGASPRPTGGISWNADNGNMRHNIYVSVNAVCDGENVVASSGTRKVALRYALEGGGVACVNN